jgi:hypothetical protein
MAGLVEQFGPCHDGGAGHGLLQHAYIEEAENSPHYPKPS